MPLAHILYPQLAKKTAEIEAELGPPGAGYLSVGNASAGSAGARAAGAEPELYTPSQAPYMKAAGMDTASFKAQKKLRAPAHYTSPDDRPGAFKRPDQVFFDAANAEAVRQNRRRYGAEAPGNMQLIPNAPAAQVTPVPAQRGYLALPSGPIGMDERGMPVQGPNTQPRTVTLPQGAIGMSESGQAVDHKGKKGGYLEQDPMVSRELGSAPSAGHLYKFGGAKGVDEIEKKYSKHLKAMQENRDSEGLPTDKFPEGYFQGMSKSEARDIKEGVDALRKLEKGVRT